MKRFSTAIITLLLLGFILSNPYFAVCQTASVPQQIQQANDATLTAFTELYKAENYGANVTELIDRLNDAVDLLAKAENAYNAGNDQLALGYALSAISLTQQVIIDSQDAQKTAFTQNKSSLGYSIVFAVTGCFSVIFILFLCWRLVKNHYITNMLNSTPEVKDH
ncbi:MAG: hypothetical protein ACQCN5_09730 [Candidatus Bathyarchaeia archaeon]